MTSKWPIRPELIPGFCSMKRLGVFLLPLDRMLVHRRVTCSIEFAGAIYTSGWREALWEYNVLAKNTTQCPLPGLEPGTLDPELSALTTTPPRLLPQGIVWCYFKAVSLCRSMYYNHAKPMVGNTFLQFIRENKTRSELYFVVYFTCYAP